VTGIGSEPDLDPGALVAALRRLGAPPPVLGFGMSRPDHVRGALAAGAAGIISGSAIVARVAANPGGEAEAVRAFVAEMKAATVRDVGA
jgi:tryptophan synthase alpha chain